MRIKIILLAFLLSILVFVDLLAQEIPLVYDVENTGADCPDPPFPSLAELPVIEELPDPFMWADSGGARMESVGDWRCRRAEIGALFEHYELGTKPEPPDSLDLQASFTDDTLLTVTVVEGVDTLTLTVPVSLPSGDGPFPALIGVGLFGPGSLPLEIFTSRGIAIIHYQEWQVANAWSSTRGDGAFFDLYPDTKRGKFIAFAWGASRIIDGLERCPEANIDLSHLAVTGCSYAGKIALFSGAFDERIALTLVQESGGGGDATWRFSETLPEGDVENLERAQGYAWYYQDLSLFNNAVTKLPFDHHELMAMVAPRALLIIGNPSMVWMAEESGHVGCKAAKEVWKAFGVPDRFGFSKVGHGDHCVLPSSQRPEVIAFVEKFLLGDTTANTNVEISPYSTDLSPWITWDTPELEGASVPPSFGDFNLMQNTPNPFILSTTIKYNLERAGNVILKIYNLTGQELETLVNGFQSAGEYEIKWQPERLSSGIYLYRLQNSGFSETKKLILLK